MRAFAAVVGIYLVVSVGEVAGAEGKRERKDLAKPQAAARKRAGVRAVSGNAAYEAACLRRAIVDLTETFGGRYPRGREYLRRLEAVRKAIAASDKGAGARLAALKREALLSNPLLGFGRLLVVKRAVTNSADWKQLALPSNHQCNSCLKRTGYDNEIALLSPIAPDGKLTTLYRPRDGGFVGEIDLHWDADRLLLSKSDRESWKVWELGLDGDRAGRPRQVSKMPSDVDSFDACYLPNGRIVFGSTAPFQSVPCWHGRERVTNLYVMNADGSGVRRLCFDQDHNFHPCVMDNGQVLYHRWDYTGPSHVFLRELMVMNPDGTGQRAIYGSNTWFPNSLYFPQPAGGGTGRIVSILSGYHGVHRMGQLVVVDTDRSGYEAEGLVRRISGRGEPIRPRIADVLVNRDWPKFLHPYPLGKGDRLRSAAKVPVPISGLRDKMSSGRRRGRTELPVADSRDRLVTFGAGKGDRHLRSASEPVPFSGGKYFVVSAWMGGKGRWGIYLADVFDNLLLIREEPGYALFEPIPLVRRPRPKIIPEKVDLARKDAVLYLHDVYTGGGLAGVPRGTIRSLRIVAYNFGYLDLAGPDKIGYGGPWEAMRILGTVPVAADGSASFRVPANTPLAVQALDAEGKAVQLMRSWMTLMPGEYSACVGCHERTSRTPTIQLAEAMRDPDEIQPWYGPARGFDFEREVQPVLNRHCVGCHDGSAEGRPDLRSEKLVPGYRGREISHLGRTRMHPGMKAATGGRIRYTPAYDALLPYIRRVSIEDDVSLLRAGEYHADTAELIQMLRKGHHGVRLDAEGWSRLVTWIDLNAPCHGTWADVHEYPTDAHRRRLDLRRLYGGPAGDPEAVSPAPPAPVKPIKPAPLPAPAAVELPGWPFDAAEAARRQGRRRDGEIDLGGGVTMKLVRIPAGEFVMGSARRDAPEDERPPARVRIARPFWIGACEVTNAQYGRFDASFDSGYYAKLHKRADDKGLPLDGPEQPALRVSWDRAMAFCRWLSKRTGRTFCLPTEAQWEYACRAGSATPMHYGRGEADFSKWANFGDKSYVGKIVTGGVSHLDPAGRALCETRFSDGAAVTAPVGSYRANAWGLHDVHGNAAEWTRSLHRPYPYRADDGRNDPHPAGRRVVRGGSFFDRPARCRSGLRLAYPPWQRVFNVGFRVVCEP